MSDTESDSGSVAAPAAMPIAPPTLKVKKAKAEEHPVLEQFKDLSAEEQANLLKHMSLAHEKTLKQALKDASKTKKTKKAKDPDAPKRPQSEANKAWIAYVKHVAAETGMKYGDAMKEASSRREAGDPAAPPKAAPKAKAAVADAESAAKPAKAKAVKAVAEPTKEEKKAAKKAAKAATAAAPAPVAAPAPAAPAQDKKAAKKAAKAAKVAPPPPPPAEEDPEVLSSWTHKGTKYYRNCMNQLWEQNDDNTQGDWVGVYSPLTDKIDMSVPEPEPAMD